MMRFHRLVNLFALAAVAVGAGTLVTRAAGPAPGSTEPVAEAAFAPEARAAAKDAPAAQREDQGRRLVPVVGRPAFFGVTKPVRELPAAPAREIKASGDPREIRNPSLADRSRRSPIKRVF